MNKDDTEILKEVQKNTRMAVKALEAMSDQVCNDKLSYELSRENLSFSKLHNKAVDMLTRESKDVYHPSAVEDMMLSGAINMNTMLNNSTSRIAELMIQGNNRGILSMCKSMNHHDNAGSMTMEVAKELMDFEEKCIEKLKEYL